ncbi:aminotransferase class IV [Microbacterium sp. NPDC007973]|uniref:aminotransferase class IV n=1 Tax=Microbacterium sp. NPDC007973 TaxID=3364182 RepID=UPI0036E72A32
MDGGVLLVSHGDGWRPSDPARPLLRADDLAATRGDGVFEAIGVFGGQPLALEAHVERLRRSLAAVGLEAWNTSSVRAGIEEAILRHAPIAEMLVKVHVSHGPEGEGPWAWIHARPNADHRSARRDGLAVALLDRGVPRGAGARAPWVLAGVKSLSYAQPRAAQREARRRGADDAVYVSTDGYLLEGQASTLIVLHGDAFSTPDPVDGALVGTTQERIFSGLARRGHAAVVRSMHSDELETADAAWLCSSGRLLAPIRSVDGRILPAAPAATATLWQALDLAARPAGAPPAVLGSVHQTASGPARGYDHE